MGAAEIGAPERRSPSPILIVLALGFLFLFFFLSHSPHRWLCERSESAPELQNRALERPVQPHKPSSRAIHLCRSERRRIVLPHFLVVHVHLSHQLHPVLLSLSRLCSPRFPFHGICHRLLRCRSRVRSVHPFRFFLANLPRIVHFTFLSFGSYLLTLHDPVVSRCPIAEDRSEASLLTPLLFQLTSQTPPSRLSAPISPNSPSDAISRILMTLAKIRIPLVCTIPPAAPPPTVPIWTPFVLKFISRTAHL